MVGPERGAMHTFLVERYLPGLDRPRLAAAVATADRLARTTHGDDAVRYVTCVLVADEETCFCVFEAPDREAVARLNQRAGFAFDRIVEAEPLLPAGPSSPGAPTVRPSDPHEGD